MPDGLRGACKQQSKYHDRVKHLEGKERRKALQKIYDLERVAQRKKSKEEEAPPEPVAEDQAQEFPAEELPPEGGRASASIACRDSIASSRTGCPDCGASSK